MRLLAFISPFVAMLLVTASVWAYDVSADQCRRMLQGLSQPTWAADNDIGYRISQLNENYNVRITHWQWVDPWRTDLSVYLGYGGVLEGDVVFLVKNAYGVVIWSIRRHFGCAANPDRDPKGHDWMKYDGKLYYGPGGI